MKVGVGRLRPPCHSSVGLQVDRDVWPAVPEPQCWAVFIPGNTTLGVDLLEGDREFTAERPWLHVADSAAGSRYFPRRCNAYDCEHEEHAAPIRQRDTLRCAHANAHGVWPHAYVQPRWSRCNNFQDIAPSTAGAGIQAHTTGSAAPPRCRHGTAHTVDGVRPARWGCGRRSGVEAHAPAAAPYAGSSGRRPF